MAADAIALAMLDMFMESDSEGEEMECLMEATQHLTTHLREDRTKTEGYFEETIPNYLPDDFTRYFKMNRETFDVLCQHLSECEQLKQRVCAGGREPIPMEKKVLMTIRYLSSMDTIRSLSDRFGVTDSSFLKCREQVINAINSSLKKFIKWPTTGDYLSISERFNDTGSYEFPNIIGAIDGSHIPIEAPAEDANAYYNRKGFHSILLQGICTHDLYFISINVGWPGRVHDAKVFNNSSICENGFRLCNNGEYHILGDGAHPLKEWLLTPYKDNGHLTRQQTLFNKALSSKRQVIERAFALLKGRFRKLRYLNCKSIRTTCDIVTAACVIHNICIIQNYLDGIEELMAVDELQTDDDNVINERENSHLGITKRLQITNSLAVNH
ncbi:putative nuclease HARBI1 [Pecten maximus]|uniref:putative nuclease HARBI1 n=1 Tax=Pecten maximus TaxID=6579 RepID=UPI0014586E19|nr:putative nuclease HARBI1 [Pecten maximus]